MPLRGEEFTGRTVEEAIERGLLELGRKSGEGFYRWQEGKPVRPPAGAARDLIAHILNRQ